MASWHIPDVFWNIPASDTTQPYIFHLTKHSSHQIVQHSPDYVHDADPNCQ